LKKLRARQWTRSAESWFPGGHLFWAGAHFNPKKPNFKGKGVSGKNPDAAGTYQKAVRGTWVGDGEGRRADTLKHWRRAGAGF